MPVLFSTPDQILARIAAIKSVIASGVNSAGYGDKRTDFRTLEELRLILNDLEQELADALGGPLRVKQVRVFGRSGKGL